MPQGYLQSMFKALQSPSSAVLCTESQMTEREADDDSDLLSQHLHPGSSVTKRSHTNFKIQENNKLTEQYFLSIPNTAGGHLTTSLFPAEPQAQLIHIKEHSYTHSRVYFCGFTL